MEEENSRLPSPAKTNAPLSPAQVNSTKPYDRTTTNQPQPIIIESFNSFQVNQVKCFEILLADQFNPSDLRVSIKDSNQKDIEKRCDWHQDNQKQFKQFNKCQVSFIAPFVDAYTISVDVTNYPSLSGRFVAKAYDLSQVHVRNAPETCYSNEIYEFEVDASNAGQGQLEISVNEGEIPNQVQVLENGRCIVNFVPEEPTVHTVDIKFNSHNVKGCPFQVQVKPQDSSRANLTNVNKPKLIKDEHILVNTATSITIRDLDTGKFDNDLLIIDPEGKIVIYNVTKTDNSIEYSFTPTVVGDYNVEIDTDSLHKIPTSILSSFPLLLKVFDHKKVIVSEVTDGCVNHPIIFFIDASQTGSGNLEIRVSSKTRNVPNTPDAGNNSRIRVSFLPTESVEHSINVNFNGLPVPNSPFLINVFETPNAIISESSLNTFKYVAIDETTKFQVDCNYLSKIKSISLDINDFHGFILGPGNVSSEFSSISVQEDGTRSSFIVELKLSRIGPHELFMFVRNQIVPGCPFVCNVYNINDIKVSFEGQAREKNKNLVGRIGQPFQFRVDASKAGEGTLSLAVNAVGSGNPVQTKIDVAEEGLGLYNLTFIPTEHTPHSIDMSFNDRTVPNSPFEIDVFSVDGESSLKPIATVASTIPTATVVTEEEESSNQTVGNGRVDLEQSEMLTDIVVHGLSLRYALLNSTNAFIIETSKSTHARDFDVLISDPHNNLVDVRCYLRGDGSLLAEWIPRRVGEHKIEVLYKGTHVPSSPFTNQTLDLSNISILNNENKQFSINNIVYKVNKLIELKVLRKRASVGSAKLEVSIINPAGIEQPFDTTTSNNNGNQLSTDNDLIDTICFTPNSIGQYKVSILYGGYEIPKSPLTITTVQQEEIDNNNILTNNKCNALITGNGIKSAEVNKISQFCIETSSLPNQIKHKDDLKVNISIGCDNKAEIVKPTIIEQQGKLGDYLVKYCCDKIGYATINILVNNIQITGSPFQVPVNDFSKLLFVVDNETKNIDDKLSETNTNGKKFKSLVYEANVETNFIVDTTNCGPGNLNAEAYCRASNALKFKLPVKRIESSADTNQYQVTFVCPPQKDQLLPSLEKFGLCQADFSTKATYLIRFYYNNLLVPEKLASVIVEPKESIVSSPSSIKKLTTKQNIVPTNSDIENNNNNSQVATTSNMSSSQTEDDDDVAYQNDDIAGGPIVALRGHGLADARCGEIAEFTIDGSKAGSGKPKVSIRTNKISIPVKITKLDSKLYKAMYEPSEAGIYLLNVLWDNKQVAGCPISINVLPNCDARKVTCTGEGLKGGSLNEEIKTFIDTRMAGPGELTAQCNGPHKVAFCELLDRGDGTFILYIKPQEAGKHYLSVKYGGEHIPNSPFEINMTGHADPSKVKVYGPGINHGVLSMFESTFYCDTRGAGAGQLTFKIRGPHGAFSIETKRERIRNRTISCKYNPTEPGKYEIEIKWSKQHVPGSPIKVVIFDTQEELLRYTWKKSLKRKGAKLPLDPNGGVVEGFNGPNAYPSDPSSATMMMMKPKTAHMTQYATNHYQRHPRHLPLTTLNPANPQLAAQAHPGYSSHVPSKQSQYSHQQPTNIMDYNQYSSLNTMSKVGSKK